METVCFKVQLRKACIDDVRAWFKTLQVRENETLETLKNEGVLVESVFLERHGEIDFLIYYIKAKDISYAGEVAKKSLLPIDLYHKECREKFCEGHEKLEQLLDLNTFTN
jgi:hypothetical protein